MLSFETYLRTKGVEAADLTPAQRAHWLVCWQRDCHPGQPIAQAQAAAPNTPQGASPAAPPPSPPAAPAESHAEPHADAPPAEPHGAEPHGS